MLYIKGFPLCDSRLGQKNMSGPQNSFSFEMYVQNSSLMWVPLISAFKIEDSTCYKGAQYSNFHASSTVLSTEFRKYLNLGKLSIFGLSTQMRAVLGTEYWVLSP